MQVSRRSLRERYGLAMLESAIAGAVAFGLLALGVHNDVVIFFLPASALVAAWFGGIGPGLLAGVLSIAGTAFLVFPPLGSLWIDSAKDRSSIALVTALCVALSWSVGALRYRFRVHTTVAEAVERSEHKFRLLFDCNPDPMFIVDANTLEFVSVNRSAVACYGFTTREFLGMRVFDLAFPSDVALSIANQRTAPPTDSSDIFKPAVWRNRTKDGTTLWVEVSASRLLLDHRECALLVVRNVTDRVLAMNALRDAEENWRALLDNSTDCFLLVDRNDLIAFASRALSGNSVEALRNRPIHDVVVAEDVPAFRAQLDTARKHAVAVPLDVRLRTANGQSVPHEGRCLPVRHDAVTMLLLVLADVTQRREQERQLSLAKEAAESASRAKDRFIAALSHELRTPLTPVLAAVTLTRTRSPESASLMDIIRRNVEVEAHLIDDLLDVSRLIAGKLTFEPQLVDLHGVVKQVITVCKPDADAKNLQLVVKLDAPTSWTRVDPLRIEQALWNLVQNAVKFTPQHGTVDISSQGVDGHVAIKVTNTDSGIAKEDLARIFYPFEQACTETCRGRGLGLGLAISKGIVDTAGGTLTAESGGPGSGASFTLQLPVEPGPLQRVAPAPGEGGPVRILLVEDDYDTAMTVSEVLRASHYDVQTAASEAAAIKAYRAAPFDIVISDVGLPDGSGLDLLPKLAAIRPVRAIALSGYGMAEDKQRSRDAGYAMHLTKPITLEKLVAAIHDVTA